MIVLDSNVLLMLATGTLLLLNGLIARSAAANAQAQASEIVDAPEGAAKQEG